MVEKNLKNNEIEINNNQNKIIVIFETNDNEEIRHFNNLIDIFIDQYKEIRLLKDLIKKQETKINKFLIEKYRTKLLERR